jgi:DNA-binding NarL/FixJ family response regulator
MTNHPPSEAITLTTRQREVAALVAAGRTPKQIAARLQISKQRVYQLLTSIGESIGADPACDVRVVIALWFHSRAA